MLRSRYTYDMLWVGTQRGVAVHDPSPDADPAWRYLRGPRWQPPGDGSVTAMAQAHFSAARFSSHVCVATSGGVTWYQAHPTTLSQKAAAMERTLVRHDRHGLVAESALGSFGNLSSVTQHDSDNNGLWTSLVVAAELFRHAVTGESSAADASEHFLGGMRLLHEITGVPGLYARSACAPSEPVGQCAPMRFSDHLADKCTNLDHPGCCDAPAGAAQACGLQWRNATVPKYKHWVWKSDTSSDETVGHFFAFFLAARLAPSAASRAAGAETVAQMTDYMIENQYVLKDWTGFATTWAKWSPAWVNGRRAWSDERGVQAQQILSFLAAAQNISSLLPSGKRTDARIARWSSAYKELTNATNDYEGNLINLKIESPIDDNYSDDELIFLPYYTLLQATSTTSDTSRRQATLASMRRTWAAVRGGRSSLWAAIALATTTASDDDAGHSGGGGTGEELAQRKADLQDLVWTLQNWPSELIQVCQCLY
jgi:hypothetical protein